MNGTDIKKAAINKAKQVAQAANGNGGKKRRKGQDLKPIITTEQQASQNASPASTGSFHYKYVLSLVPQQHARPPAPLRLLSCAHNTLCLLTATFRLY
jgi:serine/threonine-protein kinase SRPK3